MAFYVINDTVLSERLIFVSYCVIVCVCSILDDCFDSLPLPSLGVTMVTVALLSDHKLNLSHRIKNDFCRSRLLHRLLKYTTDQASYNFLNASQTMERSLDLEDLPYASCPCVCGRVFEQPGAFKFHQRSCQKNKKRLAGALSCAKEVWTSRKKRRLLNAELNLGSSESSPPEVQMTPIFNEDTANQKPSSLSLHYRITRMQKLLG